MPRKFFIIRHAQTNYNKAEQISNSLNIPHEIAEFRWDPLLVDSYLSSEGVIQCESAQPHIHSLPIDKIFVSPLRRALQTCKILFSTHPNHPKIIVSPELHEIFNNGHDISVFQGSIFEDFSEFDWSLMPENFRSWKLADECFTEELSRGDFRIDEVLGLMRKYGRLESVENVYQRAQKTKEIWRKEAESENVAIVTHSTFLREFSKKDFGDAGIWLENCECREYELD